MTGSPVGRSRRPRRIHIIGGIASGKSSLAKAIAKRTGYPVFHLDDIAMVGGLHGTERPLEERLAIVHRVSQEPVWITEGVHVGWTDELMREAEMIVWLDYVSWSRASRRIVTRFVRLAVAELRRQPGRRKFTRFGSYYRHLRSLLGALRETRHYYRSRPAAAASEDGETRAATADQLAAYSEKVVHCRAGADVTALVNRFGTSRGSAS